jgi:predicted RNase H-like HicB family nuclease
MKNYTAVVEHCPETDLYVGYVPGFRGAHSQGATLDELQRNMGVSEVYTDFLAHPRQSASSGLDAAQ